MTEKLHKVLADLGYGSRRQMEQWIEEGRVSVNGEVAPLGERVGPSDKIEVNGRLIRRHLLPNQRTRVLLYHKPEGEVCTRSDPEERPTVFDSMPYLGQGRWICVGRLDMNTAGLLLFTNNGQLANQLMHPSSNIEREYAVRVLGTLTPDVRNKLLKGVALDDGMAAFESIVDAGGSGVNHWYHVVLKEGRNREVRRLFESQDLAVNRLIRVRFAHLTLGRTLKKGKFMELDKDEIRRLFKLGS